MADSDLRGRAVEFAQQQRLTLLEELGFGVQGIVFAAKSQDLDGPFALKIHNQESGYLREREAYFRLRTLGIASIRGCNIPQLLGYDDAYFIIAMTIVVRPFVLDFGGAYLDRPPEFPEEVLAAWEKEKREQFGMHWPEVRAIRSELRSHGIYLLDVNPGNISLGD
jgi:hypothetical protein